MKTLIPDSLEPPPRSNPGIKAEPASIPTWSPTAQKSSFKACQVGVVSAGSVRGARGTSSEALGSLPNTQAFTKGKHRPLPEEGTQGQAPGFPLTPNHPPQGSQSALLSVLLPFFPASLSKPHPCLDSWPALNMNLAHFPNPFLTHLSLGSSSA